MSAAIYSEARPTNVKQTKTGRGRPIATKNYEELAKELIEQTHKLASSDNATKCTTYSTELPKWEVFDQAVLTTEIARSFTASSRNKLEWWLYRGFCLEVAKGRIWLMLFSAC